MALARNLGIGASVLLVSLAGLSVAHRAIGQAPDPNRSYGYILRHFYYPVPAEPGACPAMSLGSLEMFRDSLGPEERAKYGAPENRTALIKLMSDRLGMKIGRLPQVVRTEDADPALLDRMRTTLGIAPGKGAVISLGSRFAYDTCTNPEDFPQFARGNQTFLGKVSIGANLDGKSGKDDFTGPDGAKGIDNNLLRATGCNLGVKDSNDVALAEKSLRSQTAPTVIELRGVDSFENDDSVILRVSAAAQSVEVGANGDALRHASIDVDSDPRYTSEVRARIAGGVLTTEPFAFAMRQKESVVEAYSSFVGTRFTIRFTKEGDIAGEAFGYQTLASLDFLYRHLSQNAADFSGTSCPGILSAINRMADGYPDPRTGRNTAISGAFRFSGVPVFLIHGKNGAARSAVQ